MSANKTNRQSRRLIFNSRLCSRQCHYYSHETEPQVISLDYRARSNKKKDIFSAINTKIQNHRDCNHGSRGQLQFPYDCNTIIFGITIVSTLVDVVFYPVENLQEHHNLHTSYIVFKSNRLKLRMLRF